MEGLKPCPFCGDTEGVVGDYIQLDPEWVVTTVRCDTCGAFGPECSSRKQAIDAWNSREP